MFEKYPVDKYGRHGKGRYLFTIFTKDEHCGRGEYAEELDIFANTVGGAKKLGNAILKEYYEEGLRIARVELIF